MGKILFIRGGAVGDFILTMPALRLVREQLPDNEIEILGYPGITSLATATGLADATRSIEDARLATFFAPGAKLDPEWCDYLSGFNVVVSYLFDPDGFFRGNLERAGVKMLIEAPFRPEEELPQPPAAVQFARPLEQLALFLDDAELSLPYRDQVDSPLPLQKDGKRVILHPGSGSPSKNWSFESWIAVLQHLASEIEDLEIVITSGEAEAERLGDFRVLAEEAGLSCHYLSECSLPELGALFSETEDGRVLYLGHDSGISHLAASAGAAGRLLFGPTEPAIWAPVSSRLKPIRSRNGSMGGISVREVIESLESWTSSHPSRRD